MSEQSVRETRWGSKLAAWVTGLLLFLTLSGFSIWLLPFSVGNQVLVLLHTVLGIVCIAPAVVYLWRHWKDYRTALLTHVKVTGYAGIVILLILGVSGLVLTWQALFGVRISYAWDLVHTTATFGIPAFILPHILVPLRQLWKLKVAPPLRRSLQRYAWTTVGVVGGTFLLLLPPVLLYRPVPLERDFPPDYSYRYGEDRPFAPSLATTTHGKAIDDRVLAGSLTCGTSGCHTEIVREWEPSAHRYSAMDVAFQKI